MNFLFYLKDKLVAGAFSNKMVLGEPIKPEGNILELYDIAEKTIDMIAQPQHKLKGLVQFDYSNEKLQPGLYICVIEMNGKSYTERIIQFKKIQLLEFCYTEVNQIFK